MKKLAQSEYSERFIFKGGFLLSNIVGIDSRSTIDIDFLVRNMQLSEENIMLILNESLKRRILTRYFMKFKAFIESKKKINMEAFE